MKKEFAVQLYCAKCGDGMVTEYFTASELKDMGIVYHVNAPNFPIYYVYHDGEYECECGGKGLPPKPSTEPISKEFAALLADDEDKTPRRPRTPRTPRRHTACK